VVANLVANAFEHGATPIAMDLVGQPNAEVTFLVRDSGPGVAPAVEPVLFSRVHTLSRNHRSARAGLGTGLGLFLVKGLVEAMGGRVAYQPGDPGAAFVVTLLAPRRPADALTL
jgi:signal transduction histidine kinase